MTPELLYHSPKIDDLVNATTWPESTPRRADALISLCLEPVEEKGCEGLGFCFYNNEAYDSVPPSSTLATARCNEPRPYASLPVGSCSPRQ